MSATIEQLETRIRNLESRLESSEAVSLVSSPEIWTVETRGSSYPSVAEATVFPAVLLERTFTESIGEQALTSAYLGDETEVAQTHGWIKVHCPWYVPRLHRFQAWRDRGMNRWFAINAPRLLLVSVASVPGATGTHPDVRWGEAIAKVREPSDNASYWDSSVVSDSDGDVELPIFNISRTAISDNHLLGASVREHRLANQGVWVVDIDPCT